MSNQVYELSINELLATFKKELALATEKKNYKQIKKVNFLVNALANATLESVKVEGVRGNNANREMVNAGSLIENLVKHYRKGYLTTWKSFNELTSDEIDGFMSYEIKASLPNARNTALVEPMTVILVNTVGAFVIKKAVSLDVPMDSQGRYYENMDYSAFEGCRRLKKLSHQLGL